MDSALVFSGSIAGWCSGASDQNCVLNRRAALSTGAVQYAEIDDGPQ